VGTVDDEAWIAAADSPRSTSPRTRTIHVGPSAPLTRDQVLDLANRRDPQDAIAEIDRHALAFPLDRANLAWFEDRVAPPEVVDYLRKRGEVDWQALHRPATEPLFVPQPAPESWAEAPSAESFAPPEATPSYAPPSYSTYSAPQTIYVPQQQPTTVVVEQQAEPTYIVGGVVYGGAWVYADGGWRRERAYHHYYNAPRVVAPYYGRTLAPTYPYATGSPAYVTPRTITPPPAVNAYTSNRTSAPVVRGTYVRTGGHHHR
jgi:hypothetical protein